MAFKLKRGGILVPQLVGVFQTARGPIVRRKSVTGREGDLFPTDSIPDNYREKIESGRLDDLWEVVDDSELEPPKAEEETSEDDGSGSGDDDPKKDDGTEGGKYDPNAHNQDDVLEHLAASDDEEITRIKEAEAAGKNRQQIAAFVKGSPLS